MSLYGADFKSNININVKHLDLIKFQKSAYGFTLQLKLFRFQVSFIYCRMVVLNRDAPTKQDCF